MKKIQFIIFFSLVLLIYFAANYYVFDRSMAALTFRPEWQSPFKWVFIILVASYPVGRVLERFRYSRVSNVLHWTGAFWLGILLYGFLMTLLTDLADLFLGIPGLTPELFSGDPEKMQFIGLLSCAMVVLLINVVGHLRAISPTYRKIRIPLNKHNAETSRLRIALISDVHLGTIIGKNRLSRIIRKINNMDPDGVIIAGDLVDEDIAPVIKHNMGRCLTELQPPVFAVTGNHEYIGGVEKSLNYLQQFNIRYLRDEWVEWKGITLAGREDKDRERFTGIPRKSLPELFNQVDRNKPLILIDHQPVEMDEKQKAGVDFTISGHTHNGQNWPLNYIAKATFKVSNGYALMGNMHVYVSSGVGSWGPSVRFGTRPEIVQMDLEFYGEED